MKHHFSVNKYSEILGLDLTRKTRKQEYTYARFAVYYYLREKGWGLKKITDYFGYKSHSSICNGINQMRDKLSYGDKLAVDYYNMIKDDEYKVVTTINGVAI